MPISQPRMIAIINAALDYKQALDRLVELIHNTPPTATAEHLLTFAHLPSLLTDPINSPATIAIEYHHFRRNARRNDNHSRRAAIKRQQHGIIPRGTTPRDTFLIPTNDTFLPTNLQTPAYISTPLSIAQKQKILDEINSGLYETPATTNQQQQISTSCPTCHASDIYSCPRGLSNCKWHDRLIQLESETAAAADADFEENLEEEN